MCPLASRPLTPWKISSLKPAQRISHLPVSLPDLAPRPRWESGAGGGRWGSAWRPRGGHLWTSLPLPVGAAVCVIPVPGSTDLLPASHKALALARALQVPLGTPRLLQVLTALSGLCVPGTGGGGLVASTEAHGALGAQVLCEPAHPTRTRPAPGRRPPELSE